jgi:hypothetical protein
MIILYMLFMAFSLAFIFFVLWAIEHIRRKRLYLLICNKIDDAIQKAVKDVFNVENVIQGEIVEVIFGRRPEQTGEPELYKDDGFNYAVVQLPRDMFAKESPGSISVSYSVPGPYIYIIPPKEPIK